MEKVIVSYSKELGKIKPMHAVNNGPKHAGKEQTRGNFSEFAAAGIPYVRNHDASACMAYGGGHTVDIHAIFPNFDADVNDPASYDFFYTDTYTKTILEAGSEVFYRLGSQIEHGLKKYGTLVPKDFQKWAEICEHIIMHYNEGWADGFHWNIQYWEIWNEPDLDADDAPNKRTWSGTKAQFFDMYEVAAKHLKGRFPNLKIGGPAIAFNEEWAADFLAEMKRREVEIDFFSWHIYCTEPIQMVARAERLKKIMKINGYGHAESILNEWNYIKGWNKEYVYSIETIISMKGAAFTAACMCASQHSSVDMLMYYDARVGTTFNGMFNFYTLRPLKGYYPFKMFNTLYRMGTSAQCMVEGENLYAVGAKDEQGNASFMLTYYTDNDHAESKDVHVELDGGAEKYELYLLDENHNCELIQTVGKEFDITLEATSVLLAVNV